MCVQNFDDSRGPAIRITYRISLRSSSLWEPRHPLLKVVYIHIFRSKWTATPRCTINTQLLLDSGYILFVWYWGQDGIPSHLRASIIPSLLLGYYVILVIDIQTRQAAMDPRKVRTYYYFTGEEILDRCGNDPSAGSPTETLLRLHLPLNGKV